MNECSPGYNDCPPNALCVNEDDNAGKHNCHCDEGYWYKTDVNLHGTLRSSGGILECWDVDECRAINRCDVEHSVCINFDGGYKCQCNPGYKNSVSLVKGTETHGTDCVNIDECESGHNTCHEYAECRDTDGSFECICQVGFTGDGMVCDDIDECDDSLPFVSYGNGNDCDTHEICRNTIGSFYCDCKIGFKTGEENVDCIDRNECADGIATCDVNAMCRNTEGSYVCECKIGWQATDGGSVIPGGGGHKCYDVDECADMANVNLHQANQFCDQQCENTEGSYLCGCDIGFINKDGQGRVCVDIGIEIFLTV